MALGTSARGAGAPGGHLLRGVVCALLGGASWGFSGTCAQLLLDAYGIPALWVTCVRLAVAAVAFMAIAAVAAGKTLLACLRDTRSLVQIALFAVFGVVFTQMTYLLAIANTNAGTATVIQQVGLLIIMAITCIRVRRLPRAREVAGLVFALAGVFVIATQGDPFSLSISPQGLFWGLMCGVGLALYTLLPQGVLAKWGSLAVTGLAMLFGGAASAALVRPWTYSVELEPGAIASLAALVLVGTFLAYLLYLQGVKDAGPVRASLLCCIEPVSAMAIGAVWLGSAVSAWDIAGCALILVMIILVTGSPAQGAPDAADGGRPRGARGEAASAPAAPAAPGALPQDAPLFRGRASVLGYYASRPAARGDFAAALAMLKLVRAELVAQGLVAEGKQYPSSRRLMRSIEEGGLQVVEDSRGRMIGVFAVTLSADKNYERGIDGRWLDARRRDGGPSYAVLRWACVAPDARRRGVGMFILDKALAAARKAGRETLRADIHPENGPMRALLLKRGFARCGTVEIRDALGRRKVREAYESRA